MLAKNITIWAISTGNEPLNGVIGWLFVHFMSLGWTPENQVHIHIRIYLYILYIYLHISVSFV